MPIFSGHFRFALVALCMPVAIFAAKPRVIVTTDGEIDDQQSMIRFLMYCNEWETEGLVYSNSIYHSVGHQWNGLEWIEEQLDAYEKDYPNLVKHDAGYPTADELRSTIAVGEIRTVGWPSGSGNGSTDGSNLILKALEKDDPRPVYVQCWGGSNTAAQALYDLKHKRDYSAKEVQRIANKMVLYLVTTQEEKGSDSKEWIAREFPDLRILFLSLGFFAYRPKTEHPTWQRAWKEQYLCPRGALGEMFCQLNRWSGMIEGDTPSFLYNVGNGLRGMELPIYGSWGGRFYYYEGSKGDGWKGNGNFWYEVEEGGHQQNSLARWWDHSNYDYANRMTWTELSYEDANHPPAVGDVGALNRTVVPGQTVTLSCTGSSDPDGDELSYTWYQYYTYDVPGTAWYRDFDPWSVKAKVDIQNATSAGGASVTIPDEIGKHLLINLEVTDNGTPALTRYAQIDFEIQASVSAGPVRNGPAVSSQGRQRKSGSRIYRIDGRCIGSTTTASCRPSGLYLRKTTQGIVAEAWK